MVANLFSSDEERQEHTRVVDSQLEEDVDVNTRLAEGTQYLAAGDYERAFEILSALTTSMESDEALWFNLGVAAMKVERWQVAADAFGRAGKLNPGRADTWFQRGWALREAGQCGAAIEAMQAGLAIEPDRTNTYYHLSVCYAQVGDQAGAAKAMAEYRRRRGG